MMTLVLVPWLAVLGFWGSASETPVVSVTVAPQGGLFREWKEPTEDEEPSGVGSGSGPDAVNCKWWSGLHYYDTGACSAFAITRVAAGDMAHALERARHCAVTGETDCVLNGEIGFSIPAAFLYDASAAEMRMLIAPRYLAQDEPGPVKTVRMQDPHHEHANQLLELNTTLKIEYLKGGARTMMTEDVAGQGAYCIQALRRSIAPACWEELD